MSVTFLLMLGQYRVNPVHNFENKYKQMYFIMMYGLATHLREVTHCDVIKRQITFIVDLGW